MNDQTATPETATVDSEAGLDERTDAIMGLLGNEDAPEEPEAPAEPEDPGDDTPPGDEEPAEEPETDPEPEQPRYRVKVNGEEIEVPLDELLKGYSREADYSRKTATVAEERRALEQQREAFKAEQTERADRLNAILQQAESSDPIMAEARATDWAKLAQEDPGEYVARRARVEARVGELQAAKVERDRVMYERFQEAARKGWEQMEAAVPEWRDADKRKVMQREIQTYLLKDMGFQPQELDTLVDPRLVRLAYEGAQYRKAQAARATAADKKAPPAPTKTVTPGPARAAQPDAKLRALKARASRTGSIDDKAAAILSVI